MVYLRVIADQTSRSWSAATLISKAVPHGRFWAAVAGTLFGRLGRKAAVAGFGGQQSWTANLRWEDLPEALRIEAETYLGQRLAEVYAEKVAGLEAALNDPAIRTEAAGILRQLIDRVELLPSADGKTLDAVLHGDLATILMFCQAAGHNHNNKKAPELGAPGLMLSVVAGARSHLYRTRSYYPTGRGKQCSPSGRPYYLPIHGSGGEIPP